MRERERERAKSGPKSDLIIRLWQILPEWLKKIPRLIRAQWHGDLFDECTRRAETSARNDKLFELMGSTMQTIAEWHKANLRNQIALANKRPGRRTIYTPWNSRKSFNLTVLDNGQLGFYPPTKPSSNPCRIFVNTIPKSGTYFLAEILVSLGYETSGVHGTDDKYADDGGYIELPFEIQLGLVQPNQYHLTHVNYESIVKARRNGLGKMLTSVRDLRHVTVSFMRHQLRTTSEYPSLGNYTDKELYNFLKDEQSIFPFRVAQCCLNLQNEKYAYQVRYEELVSHDKEKMLPSLQAISEVTGCSVDDIFKAVEAKNGAQTATQTNDHVTLDRIWTKEVEELFIAKGGDVLNEKLGYPKEYIFNT